MSTLPNFSELKLLVVGDLMLDRYLKGSVKRISPEAPVPVISSCAQEDRLGGAANVAANLAALGCKVLLSGICGEDEQGQSLRGLLEARGITAALYHSAAAPTITKTRLVSGQQQLLRLDVESEFSGADQTALLKLAKEKLSGVDALIISDYAKTTLPDPQPLIQAAKSLGIPVLVDPKGSDYARYRGATLVTPNLSEFALVAGETTSDEELFARASDLREALDLDAIVVTLSERGIAGIEADSNFRIAAQAKEVFDVTGAGDTVIAVIAAALAARAPLKEAITLANLAASIVVAKTGTATLTSQELNQALLASNNNSAQLHSGVVDTDQLLQMKQECAARGEKLVLTNGCFDLLHPGHIAYLSQARALGDKLVVAVNSDASVTRLKGASRPINPLSTRLAMLAALESVDAVISFDSDTPEELIASVLPHVLVKGGDYEVEQIAGHRQVLAAGGEVEVLEFLPGFSSSELIERIKNS
jgi:D-beta-D-heptose 7-phosphate kinase/D-beta-D-heptose 1-phosphate adenosyltransferase